MPGNVYVPGTGIPSENCGTLFDSYDLAIPGKKKALSHRGGWISRLFEHTSDITLCLHLNFLNISIQPSKIQIFVLQNCSFRVDFQERLRKITSDFVLT